MYKTKNFIKLLSIALIFMSCNTNESVRLDKCNDISSSVLINSKWKYVIDSTVSGGIDYMEFHTNNKYTYYNYEIDEEFMGAYFHVNDTIYLVGLGKKSHLVNKVIQEQRTMPSFSKFVICNDSIRLVYSQEIRNKSWTDPRLNFTGDNYLVKVSNH